MNAAECFAFFLKFLFMMTPPFVISVYLSLTKGYPEELKKKIAITTTLSVFVLSCAFLFFGKFIFELFSITLDSFRIGTGALLFLSAVSLVKGLPNGVNGETNHSIAIVPLATPVTLGPAAIGYLLVYAGELTDFSQVLLCFVACTFSILCIGLMLWTASKIERFLGKNGLEVMSKLTGLILAAISSQMIFTGAQGYF